MNKLFLNGLTRKVLCFLGFHSYHKYVIENPDFEIQKILRGVSVGKFVKCKYCSAFKFIRGY